MPGKGRQIVVIGAGGHARVVVECLRMAGWNVTGCTDPDPTLRDCAGAPVIGTDDILGSVRNEGISHAFCALGDNCLRDKVGEILTGLGFTLPTVLGPGTIVSTSVQIGIGTAILPGAVVNGYSLIGPFAIINTNASVDHDCVIGRAAHIGPGVALAGDVHVGDRTFIATGTIVIPQRRIGPDSIVGAGSVVIRNLPSNIVAFGNPAGIQRSNP